jgi:hypothetical protein
VSILNQKFKECLLTCAFSWPIFFLNRFSFAKGQRTNKAIKRDIALTSNPYICNHLSNPVAFLSSAYFTFLLDRFSSSDSGFPSAESVIDWRSNLPSSLSIFQPSISSETACYLRPSLKFQTVRMLLPARAHPLCCLLRWECLSSALDLDSLLFSNRLKNSLPTRWKVFG